MNVDNIKVHLLLEDFVEEDDGTLSTLVMAEVGDDYGPTVLYMQGQGEADVLIEHFRTKIEPFVIDPGEVDED